MLREKLDALLEDKKLLIKVVAGIVLIAVILTSYIVKLRMSDEEQSNVQISQVSAISSDAAVEAELDSESEIPKDIVVDVSGAVKSPSVMILPEGSRVYEAIDKAGGLTENADLNSINRAAVLSDCDKLYIPELSEDGATEPPQMAGIVGGTEYNAGSGSVANATAKININTADHSTLQLLNGIGPVAAEKIINYRNENGRFQTIDDLKSVNGIGDKTFEKLREHITV